MLLQTVIPKPNYPKCNSNFLHFLLCMFCKHPHPVTQILQVTKHTTSSMIFRDCFYVVNTPYTQMSFKYYKLIKIVFYSCNFVKYHITLTFGRSSFRQRDSTNISPPPHHTTESSVFDLGGLVFGINERSRSENIEPLYGYKCLYTSLDLG